MTWWHSNPRRNESATIPQAQWIQLPNPPTSAECLAGIWIIWFAVDAVVDVRKILHRGKKGWQDTSWGILKQKAKKPWGVNPFNPCVFKFQPPPSFVCLQMLTGPENSSIRSCKNVTRWGSKHLVMWEISRQIYVTSLYAVDAWYSKESICTAYIITIFYYSFRIFDRSFQILLIYISGESDSEVLISILPHQCLHLLHCRCHGCGGW